ncbi:MAG TPA: hydantoinase/oxoprolinase family protein, partial [Acetobacteraceae bacterium]|nr:hydantoinase/oxoprolinase family protein [Acetobacteraceae bacterium]
GLVGGALRLDIDAARAAVAERLAGPMGCSVEEAAAGMLRLAAASMMRAIRAVSVERGRDPRQFALLAFGGNGPLFAGAIAAELGIRHVIVPPMPGVFSAFGLLVADTEHHATQSLRIRIDRADPGQFATVLERLTSQGTERLKFDGFAPAQRVLRRVALARYVGQSSELSVALPDGDPARLLGDLPERFGVEHERTYGFRAPADEPVELIGLSVIARGIAERPRLPEAVPPKRTNVPSSRRAWFAETGWVEVPVMDRAGLSPTLLRGPLIVQEYDATCLVADDAEASLDPFGNIRLQR